MKKKTFSERLFSSFIAHYCIVSSVYVFSST